MADHDDNRTRLFPGLSRQVRAAEEAGSQPSQSARTPQTDRRSDGARAAGGTVIPLRPLPEDPGPGPQTWADEGRPRRGRGRRGLLLVALVLLLAAVITLAIWGATTDLDALRRGYTYRGLTRDDRGMTTPQALSAEQATIAAMGRRTAVASPLGLTVIDTDGSELAECVATLASPVLCTSSRLALAYDAGGQTLCVIDAAMHSQTITADAPVLAADAAEGGGFCYLTSSESDKTVLTVYSDQFSEVFRWYSKSRYLTTMALSDDGQTVAAVGADSRDGVYGSSLLLLRTDQETPLADIDLGESLVLWADWVGRHCALVCHDRVLFYSADGTLTGSYDLNGRAASAAATGDGYLALSLSEGRTGDRDVLVTLRTDGTVLAELAPGLAIEQLTAAGDYVAVRTPQGVGLYTSRLSPYGSLTESGTLSGCFARDDGSVLLQTTLGVALYLP